MTEYGVTIIARETLELSASPTSEIAARALDAQKAAGLERADFVVVAVTPGELAPAAELVRTALGFE